MDMDQARDPGVTMEKHSFADEKPIAQDETVLEQLGYQQELKRSFSFLGMIGFSFSVVSSWTALGGSLIIGAESGGPPVMIWSWIGISLVTLTIAYSMAEMCSAYPVAGGQYSWAGLLAPPAYRRAFSYVCGWFLVIGLIAMGAVNNFVNANFILGIANLNHPAYTIQRWHTVLVAYVLAVIAWSFNVFAPGLFDKISRGLLVLNLSSLVVVVTTILATNDHKQPASFVFTDFVDLTGFNPAFTAVIGLLQTAYAMCCYDAPAHMAEEIHDARRVAPRAIVFAVYIGAISGFIFLVAACFCIGDIESTARSSTGVPLIQIYYDSTSSVAGATCLATLNILLGMGGSNGLFAEAGRVVYAFARDGGLPCSGWWSRVGMKDSVPMLALCLVGVVQVALNSIYFGTVTGFETVLSIATAGFYVSYGLPLLARVVALALPSSRSHAMQCMRSAGGTFDLGILSVPFNVVGLLFISLLTITFNFPTVSPVTSENMNYTSAAMGVVMVIAGATWVTTGKTSFRGPEAMTGPARTSDGLEDATSSGSDGTT